MGAINLSLLRIRFALVTMTLMKLIQCNNGMISTEAVDLLFGADLLLYGC